MVRVLVQVWEALSKVWESIWELEETPWSTAVPRKIRKSLDAVQESMRNLPNRVRQYEPFDHAQVTLEPSTPRTVVIIESEPAFVVVGDVGDILSLFLSLSLLSLLQVRDSTRLQNGFHTLLLHAINETIQVAAYSTSPTRIGLSIRSP